MDSDPVKSASDPPDAARGAPSNETNPTPAAHETIASSLSSFRGLVGLSSDSPNGAAFDPSAVQSNDSARQDSGRTPSVGQTLGRYEIRAILGAGNMGSVFLAHDSQLDREVALKVPRLEFDSTGELLQRFYREARAAATLSHPNICPIYDVSEHSGTCFIAMGYVSGKPLSAYLAAGKTQPEREAAKVVRKIALALQEAHAHGILHRDLKPTNIMIDKWGEPIVMDFGVACRFNDQTQTRLTQQGTLVGTPAYMAPEQIDNRCKVGPVADVYSLGVILYQLLSGRCPFEGSLLHVINQVLHQAPASLTNLRSDLSPEIVEICNRAMRKNPEERFPSMLDFAKALTAFLNARAPLRDPEKRPSLHSPVKVAGPKPVPVARSRPLLTPLPPRTDRQRRKKRRRLITVPIAVACAGALLVAGAWIGTLAVHSPATRTTATDDQSTRRDSAMPSEIPVAGASATAKKVFVRAGKMPPQVVSPQQGDAGTAPNVPLKNAENPHEIPIADRSSAPSTAGEGKIVAAPTATMPPVDSPKGRVPSAARPGVISKPVVLVGPPDVKAVGSHSNRPEVAGPGTVSGASAVPSKAAEARRSVSRRLDDPQGGPPRSSGAAGRGMMRPPPGGPQGPMPFDLPGPATGQTIENYFKERDANRDGKLDAMEIPLHVILRADNDKDAELNLREFQLGYKRRGRKLFGRPTRSERGRLRHRGPPPWGPPGPPDRGGPPGGPEAGGSQGGL